MNLSSIMDQDFSHSSSPTRTSTDVAGKSLKKKGVDK